ncbi:hypothetical protein PVAP13_3KG320900 [Panicum virgatum]|uniref:Myb-like domain-containing protein n=1 Tax=Panicum virgatum TaxID=38727 RepID=A0A8T0UPS2_PANVG|nr:hypothetical protein PVAP13_3KG320900 [Panicum virgatum]
MDAKDILGLPKTPFSSSQEKKSRPPKEPQRKPDGVSREVYALTGGVGMAPLMPTIEASHLKRRPAAEKEKAWSREETDQLFELCERFDLRFIVIADRFPTSRSVEDLKSRYYSVSRTLLIHRARSFDDVSGNPLVKDSYDAAHDTERKRALSALLSQTKQQERKDAETLAEAKRIMESRAASKTVDEAGMPSSSYNAMVPVDGVSPLSSTHPPLTHPNTAANSSIPNSLRALRVYLRTHALDQMVQAASASAGLRVIKRVDQTLQDLGVNLKPKVPTKAVCVEHLELQYEILTLLNLQKQLQNKEAEVLANRESSFTEAPSTPKRSNRDIDRPFVPDTVGFTGERAGKRDHKRKNTGRFIDPPPSPPQSKRPRKLKGSD